MGILEQILAAIQANTAALLASGGPATGAPAGAQTIGVVTQPLQVQQPAPAVELTADAITALIQPHLGNDTIKTALGAAMRGLGINGLPEAQPHQYAALYKAFEGVIAQHTGMASGGLGATQSII